MSTSTERQFSREALAELRHRLRTPLNHILGYSEMLLQDTSTLPATIAAELQVIHESGQQVLDLVQRVLDPDGGVSVREVDDFRASIIEPLHRAARAAGAILESGPADVIADALRIANGAAELLDFTQETIVVSRHASVRLRSDPAAAKVTSEKASILVVDDDEANRDILARQLWRIGFDATAAKNGPDALRLCEECRFDLVLVDFMMPEMDGLDVLEAIKENPRTCDIPVIIVSALDELSGISRCIQRGAEDYLFKPFDPVLLSARLSTALERTRLRAQERARTRQLEQMSEELQRSNEDLKRFAYAASHDLQAPLRTITTHLQLLERRIAKRVDPNDLELLQFPVQAAIRMNQLIKDLLTYSQVSTEERHISPVPVEQVLSITLQDLSSNIRESHATITHDPLPILLTDRVQLHQLLLNLIGNAIKYRSDTPPCIHLGASREFKAWHFSVSDNGVGIPEQHLTEVFNLFKRLHGHEIPGTGLGLSICKRIMDRLGGKIWVESEEGKGSVFHFTIPDQDTDQIPDQAA